jgi:two-component system response regulator YesN
MLNVLVVEDEKLVRKGIIGTIDWPRYGMRVCGEAATGLQALEFLQTNPTDVVFLDLGLPGLSGIPLLRAICGDFPGTKVVVLTMDQEFETIQQALRLGVVDYIAKAQINSGSIDGILNHTLEKLRQRQWGDRKGPAFPNAYALYLKGESPALWRKLQAFETCRAGAVCVVTDTRLDIPAAEALCAPFGEPLAVLRLSAPADGSREEQTRALLRFAETDLFYKFEPGRREYPCPWPPAAPTAPDPSAVTGFEDMEWLYSDPAFAKALEALRGLRLSAEALTIFFYHLYTRWAEYTGKPAPVFFEETQHCRWWHQWREWLEASRAGLRAALGFYEGGEGIVLSKVIPYIQKNYHSRLPLGDILKEANMSKSYFAKCFKTVTGKTFTAYLNSLRVRKAADLLQNTGLPVYKVAEQAGYTSCKYFKAIFYAALGMTPKEYRAKSPASPEQSSTVYSK